MAAIINIDSESETTSTVEHETISIPTETNTNTQTAIAIEAAATTAAEVTSTTKETTTTSLTNTNTQAPATSSDTLGIVGGSEQALHECTGGGGDCEAAVEKNRIAIGVTEEGSQDQPLFDDGASSLNECGVDDVGVEQINLGRKEEVVVVVVVAVKMKIEYEMGRRAESCRILSGV
ncbi:hypothetical protein BCR39DRAFT_507567 [Naematelia encephala]|uniref:Uncharacterized protein n=1 Tax=Naematelia encephala TaxID=71784 RepID=A0A1Y2ANR6_9TREE|nr:hypothetical protein BCR39DRAFT_507567 [Naematelia encephala]